MSIQSKYLLPSKSIFLMPLWLVASFHTQKHCPSLKKIGIQVMCKSLVSTKRIYRNLQKRSKKVQGPWKTIQTPKHSNQNDAQKKPSSVTSLPPPARCVCFSQKKDILHGYFQLASFQLTLVADGSPKVWDVPFDGSQEPSWYHDPSMERQLVEAQNLTQVTVWRFGMKFVESVFLRFEALDRCVESKKKKTIQTGGNF